MALFHRILSFSSPVSPVVPSATNASFALGKGPQALAQPGHPQSLRLVHPLLPSITVAPGHNRRTRGPVPAKQTLARSLMALRPPLVGLVVLVFVQPRPLLGLYRILVDLFPAFSAQLGFFSSHNSKSFEKTHLINSPLPSFLESQSCSLPSLKPPA